MKIRRSSFNDWMTNVDDSSKRIVKAISLLIWVKKNYPTSCVKNFSVNILHEKTGLHYTTLKKRLETLKQMGLVEFIGKDKRTLRFKRISATNSRNNINLDHIVFDSVKDVEKSLYAQFIVEIQIRKSFVKQVIKSYKSPKSKQEYDWAREQMKRCGIENDKFVDYGLSYKAIANKLGISIQKAMSIIKYAIWKKFIRKVKQKKQWIVTKCKGAWTAIEDLKNNQNFREGFTFAMSNCFILVKANKYVVGKRADHPLTNPSWHILDNEK